jgi:hypothetical protein
MKKYLVLFTVAFISFAPASIHAEKTIVLNTKTLIYHSPDCKWAKKCTKNCIIASKKEALEQGARACKVCIYSYLNAFIGFNKEAL